MSPDLIVVPLLPLESYEQRCKFEQWIKIVPVIAIGSGLGRDAKLLDRFEYILENFKNKIVVGDGDFFWYLTKNLERFWKGLKNVRSLILTPNLGELKRLYKSITKKDLDYDAIKDTIIKIKSPYDIFEIETHKYVPELNEMFNYLEGGNCFFILKGSFDLILSANKCFVVRNKASLKRSGGQGDVLTGLCSLYSLWATEKDIDIELGLVLASYINRRASFAAFKRKKLGMVAEDMIDEVTEVINEFIEDTTVFNDDSSQEFTKV